MNYFAHFVLVVTGYVKSPLGPYIAKDCEYTLGSIISGQWKVEVKLNRNNRLYHNLAPRGFLVKVSGTVVKIGMNSPFIQMTSREDYQRLPEDRLPILNLVRGIQNVQ